MTPAIRRPALPRLRARRDDDRIAPTAHYTAYVWHQLGLPYARELSTSTGAVLYWGFFALGEWTTRLLPSVPSMTEYLAYRHRLIDGVLAREQPDRLIELGAGLSQRTVAWALDRGVDTIDVDLPAMIELKRHKLGKLSPRLRSRLGRHHQLIVADVLTPGFASTLAGLVAGARRPAIVAEGLLSYFSLPDRLAVIRAVGQALRGVDGCMVVDVHTEGAQATLARATLGLRTAIRLLTRRRRALDPFVDVPAITRAFTDGGFEACQDEDPLAHADVLFHPTAARSPAHVMCAWIRGRRHP